MKPDLASGPSGTARHAEHADDASGANDLGAVHYAAGNAGAACVFFARAAALDPGSSIYHYNLACALLLSGRHREAAVAYLSSLNGDALLPDAHYWAWAAFKGMGITNDVITRLREALDRDPAQAHCENLPVRADLSQSTLCAIDCKVPDLAVRSLRRSMAQCKFAAIKLLTSRPANHDGIETITIDDIQSIDAYSRFVMRDLSRYIDTQFALVTQWDGYVINGGAWSEEFLAYDYIGARWSEDIVKDTGSPPEHDVGNGGFSLRSDMFLGAGSDPQLTLTHPEDTHMCRTYRPYLERAYGIRFADAATADRFSFELQLPGSRPFGFHGSFNVCQFEPDPKWMRFEFLGPDPFGR